MIKFLFHIKKGSDHLGNDYSIKKYLSDYAKDGKNYTGIQNPCWIYCFTPVSYAKTELRYLKNVFNSKNDELYIAKVYKNGDILYYKPF